MIRRASLHTDEYRSEQPIRRLCLMNLLGFQTCEKRTDKRALWTHFAIFYLVQARSTLAVVPLRLAQFVARSFHRYRGFELLCVVICWRKIGARLARRSTILVSE